MLQKLSFYVILDNYFKYAYGSSEKSESGARSEMITACCGGARYEAVRCQVAARHHNAINHARAQSAVPVSDGASTSVSLAISSPVNLLTQRRRLCVFLPEA